MWRFLNSAEQADKNSNINKAVDMLEGLQHEIEDLVGIETGVNIASSPAAFDLVLITWHQDTNGLAKYREHPAHKEVASFIGKVTAERCVVDFEY